MEIKHIGLTDGQVGKTGEKFGANIITPPPKKTLWKEYLEKFGDPLIIILLIARSTFLLISFTNTFGLDKTAEVFLSQQAFSWLFCWPRDWPLFSNKKGQQGIFTSQPG